MAGMKKESPGGEGSFEYPFAQPGDVVFARSTAIMGRLIRWAERSPGEEESWANHVGGVTTPGFLIPPTLDKPVALAKVSEALWRTEENVWWERHGNEQGYAVAVFRPRLFSGNEGVTRVVENWRTRTGGRYGWWRLLTFLGERLTCGKVPFSKLHRQDNMVVCSNHVLIGLAKDGIRVEDNLGNNPNEIDPDEFLDYCVDHTEEYKFIGQGIVPAWRVVPGYPRQRVVPGFRRRTT